MEGYRSRCLRVASVVAIIYLLAIPIQGYGASPNTGDTVFIAVDLTSVTLSSAKSSVSQDIASPSGTSGVEPSPFILWREVSTGQHYAWIMTLSSQTGAQLGMRTLISFMGAYAVQPIDILWSRNFLPSPVRGVEPSPFIVFRDYRLFYFTLMYDFDGTPIIESSHTLLLDIDPNIYGYPTSMTEMPGIAFPDGLPRLCIGTDTGHLILLINTLVAGIMVDDILRPVMEPISDLKPIPQYGFVSLGVLADRTIYGYNFSADPVKSGGDRYLQVYTIDDPRPDHATAFDVFGTRDEPLPDASMEVALVMSNGTTELALANIGAEQSGGTILDPVTEQHNNAIQAVAAGSLLMLLSDGTGVRYDPSYSPETGSSGCDIDVTDGINDDCAVVCGDANGDRQINVGDAVYVINYVFKGGSSPDPVCAGNANGDANTNVADAVYLINYVFKGGPPPIEECCL